MCRTWALLMRLSLFVHCIKNNGMRLLCCFIFCSLAIFPIVNRNVSDVQLLLLLLIISLKISLQFCLCGCVCVCVCVDFFLPAIYMRAISYSNWRRFSFTKHCRIDCPWKIETIKLFNHENRKRRQVRERTRSRANERYKALESDFERGIKRLN